MARVFKCVDVSCWYDSLPIRYSSNDNKKETTTTVNTYAAIVFPATTAAKYILVHPKSMLTQKVYTTKLLLHFTGTITESHGPNILLLARFQLHTVTLRHCLSRCHRKFCWVLFMCCKALKIQHEAMLRTIWGQHL